MAKKEKAAAPDGDEKPAGKSKLKLIIIIVVVVLLAVGLSVGGTLFFLGKKDDAPAEAKSEYGVTLCELNEFKNLDAVILAVAHEYYNNIQPSDLVKFFRSPADSLLLDLKGFWAQDAVHEQGIRLWRL